MGGTAANKWTRIAKSVQRHIVVLHVATGLTLLGLVTWATVEAPDTTLDYLRQLRWPVTAVSLVFLFRRPLAALIDRVEGGKVPTPFGSAEFAAGAGRTPKEAVRTDAEAGQPADEQAPLLSSDEGHPAQLQLEDAQQRVAELERDLTETRRQLWLHAALNFAFGGQLSLLGALRAAPDGLNRASVENFFMQLQQTNELWQATTLDAGLLEWLLRSGFVEIAPNGNYKITSPGRDLADFADTTFFARKAA